jgi:hypothetical protein
MIYLLIGFVAYQGTKEDIVSEIFQWQFKKGVLWVSTKYTKPVSYHSYNKEWTKQEIHRDVIDFLFNRLRDYRFKVYRDNY